MSVSFSSLSDDIEELVKKAQPNRVYTVCNGTTMPEGFQDIAEDILNMEVREDDTWVCTFPKSGTTWSQEMVWRIENDLDIQNSRIPQSDRTPYLEIEAYFRQKNSKCYNKVDDLECKTRIYLHSVDYVKAMKSPRFIKTHLPFHLLPLQIQTGTVKPKIVYVTRDAMDTCISFFHHNQLLGGFTGSLEDFATLFINNAVPYTPFWSHQLSYLNQKTELNILFLRYEEMLKDLPSVVRRTSKFLNRTMTEEQVDKLCHHLSFQNMKDNPSTNMEEVVRAIQQITLTDGKGKFFRSGTSGQWREKFSEEWVQRFTVWKDKNLQDADQVGGIYGCEYITGRGQ